MEKYNSNAKILLILNIATLDTISQLTAGIRNKLEEIKEEKKEEISLHLGLNVIKTLCDYIDSECDKACNFYGMK